MKPKGQADEFGPDFKDPDISFRQLVEIENSIAEKLLVINSQAGLQMLWRKEKGDRETQLVDFYLFITKRNEKYNIPGIRQVQEVESV